MDASPDDTPCRACGACCASYRVSFYWAEAEACGLPPSRVERVTPVLACLTGTNRPDPRCDALEGEVGRAVRCGAYAQRPSPCREVLPGDARCNRARHRHGLPPLPAHAPR